MMAERQLILKSWAHSPIAVEGTRRFEPRAFFPPLPCLRVQRLADEHLICRRRLSFGKWNPTVDGARSRVEVHYSPLTPYRLLRYQRGSDCQAGLGSRWLTGFEFVSRPMGLLIDSYC
ncbi:hypothetical protein VFPPC_18239 [Pochonia chlamydosporia 170]|uniref:Uncharacterized protein n=1 Tax=Pochonia chlamydosporia 170 TaxID=1380566 RepID=A0A219AP66_METCM|nr:hypothetical protein VFPPC_18239 [Pochonia chlamydosporia 170]OWT42627.1 hypothetical protein VFPPC_18239 [Pochonia chlamydosporia 170]